MFFRTVFVSKKDLGIYLSDLLEAYLAGNVEENLLVENLNQIKSLIYKDGKIDSTLTKHYLYKQKSLLINRMINKQNQL